MKDVITLKNIVQTYGDKQIINGYNLSIPDRPNKSEVIVQLGPSGCGKSTILRYIANLQKPTSGEVLVDGKPVTSCKVGMVFQKYSSFIWRSVLDNVAFGLELKGVPKSEREDRAMEMIKLVGLEGHEHKYAQSPTLSGGQLQRVAIARSLITSSNKLLMDEPFGALDVKTRLDAQNLILDITRKIETTIMVVTHDIQEAVYLANKIIIMGNAPSKIIHEIEVPIGERNKDIKRTRQFIDMVNNIEDLMMNIEQSK
jgi:NitT/TauT family transport system ATP-binding protein